MGVPLRILGIDFGEKRLGFAVGDTEGRMALPLCMVEVKSLQESVAAACRIFAESEAGSVVVGTPVSMSGRETAMSKRVDLFRAELEKKLNLPVKLWDERFSSQIAERSMLEADLSRKTRKRLIDKLAARAILQGYLDSLPE